jgi:hypothetical protein
MLSRMVDQNANYAFTVLARRESGIVPTSLRYE